MSVRTEMRNHPRTHGDEKPPPPIRDGRVYRGKERMYGGKEWVQGRRGRSLRRGVGAEPPHWLNNTFLFWRSLKFFYYNYNSSV